MYESGISIAVAELHAYGALENSEAAARCNVLGISMFPTLIPDGLTEPQYPYTAAILQASYEERMAVPSPCTIDFSGSISDQNLNLQITVTKDADATMESPRIHAVITEDHVNTDYNFVARDFIPTQNGTEITFENNIATLSLDAQLDASWVVENLKVIVFVDNATNHQVYQALHKDITDLGPSLAAPTALDATINDNDVTLTWVAPATELTILNYKLYRDSEFVTDIASDQMNYEDSDVDYGIHNYHVTAIYAEGESSPSNVTEVNIGFFAPTNCQAILEDQNIRVSWNAPVTGANILGYKVYRNSTMHTQLDGNIITYLDESPTLGANQYYITALYLDYESTPSDSSEVINVSNEEVVESNNKLLSVYPNPFVVNSSRNSNVTISFAAFDKNSPISLNIYDIRGKKVASLLNNQRFDSGQITWNCEDSNLKPVASGIYFVKLSDNTRHVTQKISVIK